MAAATKAVEAVDVIDDVKDLVEDTSEYVEERVSWLIQNPKAVAVTALLAGLACGGALGYLFATRRLETKYQAIADEQIEDVKKHYSILRKDNVSLEELASQYTQEEHDQNKLIIRSEGYTPYDKVDVVAEPATVEIVDKARELAEDANDLADVVARNVFESDDPETYFDFNEELERREKYPDRPFVITQEEFNQGDEDYNQATLTYYDGDDVLADEQDSPIDNIDKTVGVENMLRFGHGSGDRNVVYIRNNKLELDFEVLHSDGKFAKEVLGFDDELQHSHTRRPRKFRSTDE